MMKPVSQQNRAITREGTDYRAYVDGSEVGTIKICSNEISFNRNFIWNVHIEQKLPAAYVYNLNVKEEFRRNGVATHMLGFAEQVALENGIYHMRLTANALDPKLTKFYSKRGYENLKCVSFMQEGYGERTIWYNFFQKDISKPEKRLPYYTDPRLILRTD